MALNVSALATAMRDGLGQTDPVTAQLTAWATGIINEITTNCSVSNAPGTITGTAPPSPGPLTLGAGSNGTMAGMDGSSMASEVSNADPTDYPTVTPELEGFCKGIVSHIQTSGVVSFATGSIVGAVTNTPVSPGTFTGTGSGGTISGLTGAAMASLVQSEAGFPSVTPEILGMCDAIATHIMANAQVSYATVTGATSAGGGPLIAGTASGGTIS